MNDKQRVYLQGLGYGFAIGILLGALAGSMWPLVERKPMAVVDSFGPCAEVAGVGPSGILLGADGKPCGNCCAYLSGKP